MWSSNALTLSAQPALPTTPPLSEASALPAYLITRSSMKAAKSSAEMEPKTALNNAMTGTQSMEMAAHLHVSKNLIIFAPDGQVTAFFSLSVETELWKRPLSNVMTAIRIQMTDVTLLASLNMGFTGILLLTLSTPFVMIV